MRPLNACRTWSAIATVAAAGVLSSGCADKPLPSAAARGTGPARIVLDLQRQNQVAGALTTVDVQVSYQRTAGGDKQFFEQQVGTVTGEQQLSVSVNLADCLADPAHVGAAGVCTMDVAVLLRDPSDSVLDRQAFGPLVASPGGTATSQATLYTPTQPIAVADGFACALKVGVAYCWGSNFGGLLGAGDTTAHFGATAVAGGFRFIALAAGFQAACGLTGDGVVACWGLNLFGEVGDGTLTRDKSTPGPVSGVLKFKSIAAGTGYFCAISQAGATYCWGLNDLGNLGDGTSTTRLVPTPVSTTLQFTSLAPGETHTCGLTASGAAYCWGDNTYGAVGDGTNTSRLTPVAVTGGLTFASIAAGAEQSCGITGPGVAYCWGRNDSGEIGDGTTTSRTAPTLVAGGHTFTKLAGAHNGNGEDTTCGIATDGTLYCWGSNIEGQIGDGTLTGRLLPTAIGGNRHFTTLDLDNEGGCALTAPGTPYCWGRGTSTGGSVIRSVPTAVSGVQGVIAMSAGSYHTCALLASGAAECWGDNTGNVLGGATTVVQTSVPLPVTGGVAFSAISSGEADTCGLAAGGSVYCWGPRFNTDGTIAQSNNPSPILGGLSFATISVGTGTMQVCGITTGSAAYCMGPNASGQIGDGTIFLRPAPVAVNTTQAFTLIGTSNANTCGLTTSGAAFCWGANNSGQLGSGGSTASQLSPVPVIGGLTFAALSTGVQHSCAITAAGAAYCWGLNSSGQLGNGTTSASSSATPPGAVTGGLTFAKIAAGLAHTCALTPAGVAYCWGNNFDGGLGNGTVTNRTSPVAVAGGLTFAGITSGASHTCAWTQAGTAYCWGDNAEGQIGDGTSTPLIPVLIPLP